MTIENLIQLKQTAACGMRILPSDTMRLIAEVERLTAENERLKADKAEAIKDGHAGF